MPNASLSSPHPQQEAFALAARAGDEALARALLGEGVDPNAPFEQRLPLLDAVDNRDEGMVRLLLASGASADILDARSCSALTRALSLGDAALVAILAPVSTPVDEDSGQFSALMRAAWTPQTPEEMFGLLAPFVDANLQDSQGRAALHIAIFRGNAVGARFLAPRTDLTLRDHEGFTPLARSVWQCQTPIFASVFQSLRAVSDPRAIVDSVNHDGDTALILAVERRFPFAVEALAPLADCERKNRKGLTAFDLAVSAANKQLIPREEDLQSIDALAEHARPEAVLRAIKGHTAFSSCPRLVARVESILLAREIQSVAQSATPPSQTDRGDASLNPHRSENPSPASCDRAASQTGDSGGEKPKTAPSRRL